MLSAEPPTCNFDTWVWQRPAGCCLPTFFPLPPGAPSWTLFPRLLCSQDGHVTEFWPAGRGESCCASLPSLVYQTLALYSTFSLVAACCQNTKIQGRPGRCRQWRSYQVERLCTLNDFGERVLSYPWSAGQGIDENSTASFKPLSAMHCILRQ